MECLLACRSKPPEEEERKKRGRKREDKEDKPAGKDYEHDKKWTESEKYVKKSHITACRLERFIRCHPRMCFLCQFLAKHFYFIFE